jgi:hypothetical protein
MGHSTVATHIIVREVPRAKAVPHCSAPDLASSSALVELAGLILHNGNVNT